LLKTKSEEKLRIYQIKIGEYSISINTIDQPAEHKELYNSRDKYKYDK